VARLIAIAVLLIVASNATLPALFADSESTLPPCCRRDGKHHCTMMAMLEMQEQSAGPAVKAKAQKCPMFPKAPTPFFMGHPAPSRAATLAEPVGTHPVAKAQPEVLYRISHGRARQKRGPPSLL